MSMPSDPAEVMVIRNITPNIVTLSIPFERYGLLKFGTRATIGKCFFFRLSPFFAVFD